MANSRFAFGFQSAADLPRTPLLFQQGVNAGSQFWGQLDRFGLVRVALLRLLVSVAALPPVAGQFTTDRRLAAPQCQRYFRGRILHVVPRGHKCRVSI